MHATTATSERIDHWIRMRPFLARFSEPVWSGHLPSWADFITTTAELKFSVYTARTDDRSRLHEDATSCLPLRSSYGNCRSPPAADESSGADRMTRNKLPSVPSLASSMCPAFAWTAQRAIASPSPTPPSSLERLVSTR